MTALIIVGVFVACILFIAWQMAHAPEGYQDQNGFHFGQKK